MDKSFIEISLFFSMVLVVALMGQAGYSYGKTEVLEKWNRVLLEASEGKNGR